MQIVNRPRKEDPSKSAMLLSHWQEGGSFEECDAAKPRKNVMQLTQVLNAQNKVHIKRESVLQLKLLPIGAGPWGHGSKPAVSLIFEPEVRQELREPHPPDMVDGNNFLALTAATPSGGKTVCGNREGASPKDTCDTG